MFKDPFQPEETAYELLGLEPSASPKDVQEALPRFMRDPKKLPKLALAQQATQVGTLDVAWIEPARHRKLPGRFERLEQGIGLEDILAGELGPPHFRTDVG